jgi:hypothetical protein
MTRQRRRKGAQDGDLAEVRQLIDWLHCEEGGWHGMAVVDSDEERWARTGVNGCSGGAAPRSSSLVMELTARPEELRVDCCTRRRSSATSAQQGVVRLGRRSGRAWQRCRELDGARSSTKGELRRRSSVSSGGGKEKEATISKGHDRCMEGGA